MDDEDKKLLRQIIGVLQAKQAHLAERMAVNRTALEAQIHTLDAKVKKIQAQLEWC